MLLLLYMLFVYSFGMHAILCTSECKMPVFESINLIDSIVFKIVTRCNYKVHDMTCTRAVFIMRISNHDVINFMVVQTNRSK